MSAQENRELLRPDPGRPAGPGRPHRGGPAGSVARSVAGFAVVMVVFACPAFLGLGSYPLYLASETLIYLLAAAGLNVILGYAGQISMAQSAFMGVGGYAVAILVFKEGLPVVPALLTGIACGFGLGLVIGLAAIRVATHYLAVITVGVQVLFGLLATYQVSLTGGDLGLIGTALPDLGWTGLSATGQAQVYIAVVVTVILGVLFAVLNSSWGRAFKAIRENPVRAAAAGIHVSGYKLLAFAIGSAMGAAAGGLLASLTGYVDPSTFQLTLSFELMMMVVVGGAGRFEGPLAGAIVIVIVPEVLRSAANYALVIYAVVTIVVILYFPAGLSPLWTVPYQRIFRRPMPPLTK